MTDQIKIGADYQAWLKARNAGDTVEAALGYIAEQATAVLGEE